MATKTEGLTRVALIGGVGGLLFGYDTAVINGATQYLALHFGLSPAKEGLAVASALLGCIPGALVAGRMADRIGRRPTLFACALLFLLSGIASATVETFPQFIVTRLAAGLSIGLCSMICPVFISELAPPASRGRLGTLFQLGIVTGIFFTLFINAFIQSLGNAAWNAAMGWRWMLGSEVVPAAILMGLVFGARESPRWLSGQITGPENAREPVFGTQHRRALMIALVIAVVSQLSGINAIMYYSTRIFFRAGIGIANAFWATMLVGFVNLIFTLVALAFIDRAGRRVLLLFGLAIQTVSLSLVGALFLHPSEGPFLLLSILSFIAAFAMALGPISWLLPSEIFADSVRGRAMALVAFTVWVGAYLVAQTFPILNDSPSFGPAATFFLYAVISFAGLLFTYFTLPETRLLSLEAASEAVRKGERFRGLFP